MLARLKRRFFHLWLFAISHSHYGLCLSPLSNPQPPLSDLPTLIPPSSTNASLPKKTSHLTSNTSIPTPRAPLELILPHSRPHNISETKSQCTPRPLTPELWKELKLDEYLRTYPFGESLPLEAYAEKVGAMNFVCGIGKSCDASQICMPVSAPDWYILVAVQNWNSFSNMMYDATGFAISILQGLVNSIVNDIVPHEPDTLAIQSTLLGLFAGLCGAIPGFVYPEALSFFGSTMWPFVQGGVGFMSGIAWTYHNLYASLPTDELSKTNDISYLLSKAQASTQTMLANTTETATKQGISSQSGLYGILKDGIFLNNHFSGSEMSEGEIQTAISRVARARLLAAIWKAKGYFVIRGSDPCTQDGPNGAFPQDDVMSHCDQEGMMMQLVSSTDGKLIKKFQWAHLISAKYNLKIEYFLEHSWSCQQKYLKYAYDPYLNSFLPADPDAECIVSLAVCDMTRKDIHKYRKRHGTLAACRDVGMLPNI
ncbi:hypothetical protein CROQUDRAFT_45594 [Cronartium quercuum f. sp. fusiforme G11]|uniref:DUF7872 domain-containing protein n=1 Tax=Cronartium quercuum f. sp. fusiforme G11 TaxID=708437 RepID=A0A9P6NGK8_9BASI|nr:hypothetical protein CROQUDRAFT_45594 [Cronartium quercuum f. sp. fusiforme G11]